MTNPVRIGVIGCGYWGPNYARVFSEIPSCEVKWLCDTSQQPLERIRQAYPLAHFSKTHEEVVHDPQTDAIVVSTPASTHSQIVIDALKSGKHVLVEKPTATSLVAAMTMWEVANNSRRVLMTGHVYLSHPAILKAKEIIDSGSLGQIQYIAATRTGLGPLRSDVNVLWDLAPHDLSVMFLLSKDTPRQVSSIGGSYVNKGIHDVATVSCNYDGGLMTHILVSWLAPLKERRITVVGSKAMLVFDDTTNLERLKIFHKGIRKTDDPSSYGEFKMVTHEGDILSPRVDPSEPLKLQCQKFLDHIRRGYYPSELQNLEKGVMTVLDGAQRSIDANGVPVSLAQHRFEL